jgi:hypothetical protein
MPCCAVLLLLTLGPRFAIALIALFSNYLGRAYDSFFWPFLGWLFMPWTTLAYAWAINSHGSVEGFHMAVVIVAVLVDLGVVGGGAKQKYKRK